MRCAALCAAVGLAACGGPSPREPVSSAGLSVELLICRARIDNEHLFTEVILRTVQGLGDLRLLSRRGIETGARAHPDGVRVVFSRERDLGRESSRELYSDSRDGSVPQTRLTVNNFIDDSPCWSPDGSRLLFSSDRTGGRRLWLMDADGQNPVLFTDGGTPDRDPDWDAMTNRVVFTRWIPGLQRWNLFLINDNGSGLTTLTDGAAADDREPAFSPDGQKVVFSRTLGPDRSQLMAVDVLTKTVSELGDGLGEARFPRWSPRGDRLFVARSRPAEGLPGLRLYATGPDGGEPLLLIPDKRFFYPGFDPLPNMPARPATDPIPLPGDLRAALVGITAGALSMGSEVLLPDRDGVAVGVVTELFKGREIAAIEVRVPLPVDDPADIASVRVEVTAALRRTDPDSYLRVGLRNFAENRFDTIAEVVPTDTGFVNLSFTTSSLAHVDRDGVLDLEVIGDFSPGAVTELWVDHVGLQVIRHSQ